MPWTLSKEECQDTFIVTRSSSPASIYPTVVSTECLYEGFFNVMLLSLSQCQTTNQYQKYNEIISMCTISIIDYQSISEI